MGLAGLNKYVNFYRAQIVENVDPAQLQIEVSTSEGLPDVQDGEYFYLTLNAIFAITNTEIVKCVAVNDTTLTVQRGQDGTEARNFFVGDRVNGNFVAGSLDDLQEDWEVAEAGLNLLIAQNDITNTAQDGEIVVLTTKVGDNTLAIAANAAALAIEEGRIDNLELVELIDITTDGADAFYAVQADGVSTADPIATLNDIAASGPGTLVTKLIIPDGAGSVNLDFVAPVDGWYRFIVNGQQGGGPQVLSETTIRVFSNLVEVFTEQYDHGYIPSGGITTGHWNFQVIFEALMTAGAATVNLSMFAEGDYGWNPPSAPSAESYILVVGAEVT